MLFEKFASFITEEILTNLLFEITSGEVIKPTRDANILKLIKSNIPAKKIKKKIYINFFFLPLITLRNLKNNLSSFKTLLV